MVLSFFEEIEGVRIHCQKIGNGPQVLLFLHGAIGGFDYLEPKN